MMTLERQFAQIVAEHKSTIYTVCYMFSQDADEVNGIAVTSGRGSTASPSTPAYQLTGRSDAQPQPD